MGGVPYTSPWDRVALDARLSRRISLRLACAQAARAAFLRLLRLLENDQTAWMES